MERLENCSNEHLIIDILCMTTPAMQEIIDSVIISDKESIRLLTEFSKANYLKGFDFQAIEERNSIDYLSCQIAKDSNQKLLDLASKLELAELELMLKNNLSDDIGFDFPMLKEI